MKNLLLFASIVCLSLSSCATPSPTIISTLESTEVDPALNSINGDYTLVIEGFDWGPAASKIILSVGDTIAQVSGEDYEVIVSKATPCTELKPVEATGKLKVLYAYISDAKANRMAEGTNITLVLNVAPFEQMNSTFKYFAQNPNCRGNQWVDFDLTITNKTSKQVWNNETDRVIPIVDEFDLEGSYTHKDVTLTYASFTPKVKAGKQPLIIWLHGGGEGGTDTTIPLLANRAANYASTEMQSYFEGAYVLVPQTPTFWMDKGNGQYTRGETNDMYNESLMALIENYVDGNSNIDKDRIYVGGCSNGGYMTLKLLMLRPDYFAAAFPSALAYHAKNLTDTDVEKIKDIPMWFIHSADDPVTVASETVIPTYQKLIAGGAKNVHFSYFDHVTDITNQFGGDDFHYMGHFSWIYSHANKCQIDYDGEPVKVDGQPVTLMGWLARQNRASK